MSSNISYHLFFHLCFLLFISTNCLAKTTFHPKTLFLAVKKDPSTHLYITEIQQRTPLVPVKVALHLGGEGLWVDCQNGYKSSTYKYAPCNARQCSLANSNSCHLYCYENKTRPGCNDKACYTVVDNGDSFFEYAEVAEDVLSIQSINGSIYAGGPVVTVPKFIFSCIPSLMTEGLGKDVMGMVGFGQQSLVSLATQLAFAFRFSRKFAICLSPQENGVIFIGHSPYLFALGFDASRDLIYTPIITFPHIFIRKNSRPSPEYYIQVSSLRINGKTLALNNTLLSFDENNYGGTRISTVVPYTVLEASIYNAVSKTFVNEMPKDVKTVAPVQPFKTCFNSIYIGMSRLGYNAPDINIVLHKPDVYWTITGANSLVKVSESVVCLAFVERSQTWGQSIVIGGYQMQDNLVEFDLARRRIGFSNSLYFRQTMCSNHFYT